MQEGENTVSSSAQGYTSAEMVMRVMESHAGAFYEWAKRGQDGKAWQVLEKSSKSTVKGKHLMGKVIFQLKGKAASCQKQGTSFILAVDFCDIGQVREGAQLPGQCARLTSTFSSY